MTNLQKLILAGGTLLFGYLIYMKIDQQKKDIAAINYFYQTKSELENE